MPNYTARETETCHRARRIAIFQRVVPEYRVGVFRKIARLPETDLTLISGSQLPVDVGFAHRYVRALRLSFAGREAFFHPSIIFDAIRGRYDVVVVEGSTRMLSSVLLALLSPVLRTRVVWWTSMWQPNGGVRRPTGLKGWVTRQALKRSRSVITYGEQAARLASQLGTLRERIVVAHNSLDTTELRDAENVWRSDPQRLVGLRDAYRLAGGPIILFVGRLIREKRIADLLQAVRRLRSMLPDVRPIVVVVGEGADRGRAEQIAAELQLDVRFVGELRDPNALCGFFLVSDALVLPGSGGLAIMQALFYGLPVIAAAGAGDGTEFDLIEHGVNGYLFEPGNQGQLADCLVHVLTASEGHRKKMQAAARAVVSERVNEKRLAASFLAAFEIAAPDACSVVREAAG